MQDYAKGFAMGNNQYPLTNAAVPIKAIVTTTSENATTSSMVGFGDNTTAIEIATSGAGVAIRWVFATDGTGPATSVLTAAGTSNFDHIVSANSFRRFVLPVETSNSAQGYGSMVGARVANGLFARIAYKSIGIGSVMLTEYGSSNTY